MSISESAARQLARRRGYRVEKSRDRQQHYNNRGEYRLLDDRGTLVTGLNFDAPLAEIAKELRKVPVKIRAARRSKTRKKES